MAGMLAVCACGCRESTSDRDVASSEQKQIVVGVSLLNLSNEFIVMLNEAMEARAEELGIELIVNDAQCSAERRVQQIENFIVQKVDVINLNPCELESSSPAVDKAAAAGIPIINVNSETRSKPTAFVGSRDEESARIAMEYIADRLNGDGNVLMMHGFMGQTAQIRRDQGAREVLAKYQNLHMLADLTAECDRAKAITLMENWIRSFGGSIDAVFAQNDEMGMGAVIALEQANMKDKVVVASVDAIADALEAVKNGRLDATVFQDAVGQGSMAAMTAVKIVKQESFDKEVFIPLQLVTSENVDQFLQ